MKLKLINIFNILFVVILFVYTRYVLQIVFYNLRHNESYLDVRNNLILNFILLSLILLITISLIFYNILTHTVKKQQNKYCLDGQTKFYNKNKMWQDLEELSNKRIEFSLIYADIDNLKKINDTYGHMAGDILIEHFTKNVLMISEKAKCYRFGGDEFIIIIKNNEIDLQKYVEELEKISKNEFVIIDDCTSEPITIYPEFSIGTADTNTDGRDGKQLVDFADKRMYFKKKSKKQA